MAQTASTPRREVTVTAGRLGLPGILRVPARPAGIVVFAHGSGSSRLSARNARVADVLDLNEQMRLALRCECELALVPGATHLFEEPGALETVARLACDWFLDHLRD